MKTQLATVIYNCGYFRLSALYVIRIYIIPSVIYWMNHDSVKVGYGIQGAEVPGNVAV